MRIGLIDVDGHNFPNLPLMKLSAWHKQQGDSVEMVFPLDTYDKVYMSKVFDFTPDINYMPQADEVFKGGTGYGITVTLPDEVEHIMPDYSLYPQYNEAYGFLTRGCPRGCDFCIVAGKEGRASKKVADLSEFWDGQKVIKLLDPNLLACKEHENLLQQLIDSKAWVDFTQGVDLRMLTNDNVQLLNQVKTKMIHFAWDNPRDDLTDKFIWFKDKTKLDRRKLGVYVLTNFNSTFEEDLHRIYTLRDIGYDPYVMVFDKQHAPKYIRKLQRWVNCKWIFRSVERFEDYK